MDYIFAYANTASLREELKTVKIDSMQIGDVFIQKGRPFGHAVIVVDMAKNDSTAQKLYMLAQSYMPAQETQILINPNNENGGLSIGSFWLPEDSNKIPWIVTSSNYFENKNKK